MALAGDWHANVDHAVAAIRYAKEQGANVLVHVGDFGFRFERRFVEAVIVQLFRLDMPLMFVEGNHDDPSPLNDPLAPNGLCEIGQNLWHIPRGFRWRWAGKTWLGCGGAHSVDRQWRIPGYSWWPEETITEADVDRCSTGPADVLVCHDTPAGYRIPGLGDGSVFPASEIAAAERHRDVLRRIVDATHPRTIVHGHYHLAYDVDVDLGYGPVRVVGLDMDGGALDRNVRVFDIEEFA